MAIISALNDETFAIVIDTLLREHDCHSITKQYKYVFTESGKYFLECWKYMYI